MGWAGFYERIPLLARGHIVLPPFGCRLRAIPDEKLDVAKELPSGTMTVQQRIERVLIGHIQGHQGSIEATIA